jgi:heme/copper-type cytochrome/quinol oxidase subunit 4
MRRLDSSITWVRKLIYQLYIITIAIMVMGLLLICTFVVLDTKNSEAVGILIFIFTIIIIPVIYFRYLYYHRSQDHYMMVDEYDHV